MAPGPQPTYLDRVVMEIIETERSYVRDLRMIVEDYLAHIIETSELCLRPEQVCALFGNIEDIYEFNSELLQALDMCDHDPVAVARCFVLKSEYFEIYTQYCTNYPNSVAALTECMRSESLAGFFRERQASLKRSLPLGSYLLRPVQRILKYHLLLQEIAKHFDQREEGYEVVEEAIFTMTGVAWYINDMKRKHEHAVRLQEVQSLLWNWNGSDLTTYGELVLEGTFKVQRGRKDRTLFLFDRMLLICKRRGDVYLYKTHISCSTLMFIESSKDSLSFSVAHYKQPKKAHSVQARNLEEKKLWAHHIKRIILENHPAIIPQRAKEAILDLDSVQAPRFRYSPDRLKKNLGQSEDSPPVVQCPKGGGVSEGGGASATRPDESSGTEATLEPVSRRPSGPGSNVSTAADPPLVPVKSSTDQETTEPPQSPGPGPDPPETPKPDLDSEPAGEPAEEPAEEPSSAAPDSDSKTLSSGESSEEDEEGPGGGASSILPSSVLDRAGAIAQHFSGSVKRGSVPEDSPGFASPRLPSRTGSAADWASPRLPSRTGSVADWASPRLPSRTGSALSLRAETSDRPPSLGGASSNAAETFGSTDPFSPSPRDDDSVFDEDHHGGGGGAPRRRDSTLSKQDQLLIGKIRAYYETAGSHDATFSLRRRESLTYIPTGLVRSSVSRFDSATQDRTGSSPDPEAEPQDPSGSIQRGTSAPDSGPERTAEEEEFRPSSEMIRIWQAMERDLVPARDPNPHKPSKNPSDPHPTPSCQLEGGPSDPVGGASDSVTVDSSSSRPKSSSVVNQTGSLKESWKALGAPGPRVVQLRAEAHESGPGSGSNQNQLESKVLHLARQYSQRIKGTRPMVRQSPAVVDCRKTLACVVEEESPGKVNRTLPRRRGTKTTAPEPSAPGLPCRSRGLSPGRPQTPPSGPLPVEVFDWPDVRELRTRYTNSKSPTVRTWSVPDQIGYGSPRRWSTSDQIGDGSPRRRSTSDQIGDGIPRRRSNPDQTGDGGPRRRLHRADSLDPRLGGLQEFQDHVRSRTYPGHYVAAEAPLPGDPDHKVLVLEKLPAETTSEDEDQDYVQIRSPTSREKISIMAVVDRCRVYQESDQYRTRAEPDSTEGDLSPKTRGANGVKLRPAESLRDPKRPKETDGGQQRPADSSGAKPDGGRQRPADSSEAKPDRGQQRPADSSGAKPDGGRQRPADSSGAKPDGGQQRPADSSGAKPDGGRQRPADSSGAKPDGVQQRPADSSGAKLDGGQQRPADSSGAKPDGVQQRPADSSGAKPDGGQQSLVKNLREKFQNLN